MADHHRDDDEVLADLERDLLDHDPDLTDRFTAHAVYGRWPVRALTLTWLLWTSAWFMFFLTTHNPAALVLAATSAIAYPLGLAAAIRLRRPHHQQQPRRET